MSSSSLLLNRNTVYSNQYVQLHKQMHINVNMHFNNKVDVALPLQQGRTATLVQDLILSCHMSAH
jgi:hypothetical protein